MHWDWFKNGFSLQIKNVKNIWCCRQKQAGRCCLSKCASSSTCWRPTTLVSSTRTTGAPPIGWTGTNLWTSRCYNILQQYYIICPIKVGMPGGVDPVLRFMVKFYMPDPSQLEEEYTRYNLIMLIMKLNTLIISIMMNFHYMSDPSQLWEEWNIWRCFDHVGDDDVLPHQVPLLTANQKGPGLGATAGANKKQPFWWHFTRALSLSFKLKYSST